MRAQTGFLLAISLCLGGCATLPGRSLDITNPGSHDTWVCKGTYGATGQTGGRQDKSQLLVYPNMVLSKIEIDFPGHSLPCGGGASCEVTRQGTTTVISIKPAAGTRPDPTYSETLQFDQSTNRLQFGGGGLDGEWGFTGICKPK
jgi:hypothetical protein